MLLRTKVDYVATKLAMRIYSMTSLRRRTSSKSVMLVQNLVSRLLSSIAKSQRPCMQWFRSVLVVAFWQDWQKPLLTNTLPARIHTLKAVSGCKMTVMFSMVTPMTCRTYGIQMLDAPRKENWCMQWPKGMLMHAWYPYDQDVRSCTKRYQWQSGRPDTHLAIWRERARLPQEVPEHEATIQYTICSKATSTSKTDCSFPIGLDRSRQMKHRTEREKGKERFCVWYGENCRGRRQNI